MRKELKKDIITANNINATPLICNVLYVLSGKKYFDPRTMIGVLLCNSITVIAGETPAVERVKPANCIVSNVAIISSFECGNSVICIGA